MPTHRRGFTFVELLVVTSISGILAAILLPAVQAAREAGRRATCQNNLRQIGTALELHVAATKRLPSGGWGHEWTGVPGRGSDKNQPGGWVYSILPYLELDDLHELGLHQIGTAREEAYSLRLATPLSMFSCPSRRVCAIWEVAGNYGYAGTPRPYGHASRIARSDYAINGGSSYVLSFPGPSTLEMGDDPVYWRNVTYVGKFSGVSHLRTAALLSSFDDGLSKTYLTGEKMIDPANYESGLSPGDNDSIYSGYTNDLHRFAGMAGSSQPWMPPVPDGVENIDPPGFVRFGSAHGDGLHMANCDGAVKFISFDIDPEVHFRAGHRRDGGIPIARVK